MPENLAIRLEAVSKVYRLHANQRDQLIDVLGLKLFGFRPKTPPREFAALSNISIDVPKGHRIGIIGRNGAGKTTLLKLICGNFSPTKGEITVNGQVQALMSVGLGFHPEYTGRENVYAALQYNGLSKGQYEEAVAGIIEFCELGEYLDQPFRTYSLGMQARLMFAAATAIKPDILIVDEVLGAGDAYFVAKSKARVESMISGGCTMLLVSHSMQQVLELCDEAIWMEQGSIRMRGESFVVVKAYEESLHGRMKTIVPVKYANQNPQHQMLPPSPSEVAAAQQMQMESRFSLPDGMQLQMPNFAPHMYSPQFPAYAVDEINMFHHVARGGISRWDSERGVKVTGFAIQTERCIENHVRTLHPVRFLVTLTAELDGNYSCTYGVIFHNLKGETAARIWSPPDDFVLKAEDTRVIELVFNPLQLGPGEYLIGLTILESTPIELVNQSTRYDQLARSFEFSVDMDASMLTASADFMHSAEWVFS